MSLSQDLEGRPAPARPERPRLRSPRLEGVPNRSRHSPAALELMHAPLHLTSKCWREKLRERHH
jgi:hypothetical protein